MCQKVPHKSVLVQQKVPHKNVIYLLIVLKTSILFGATIAAHPGMTGLRFSMSDYREQEGMTNVPLYAVRIYLGARL